MSKGLQVPAAAAIWPARTLLQSLDCEETMRPGPNQKRARGRGRKPHNNSNRPLDSNGPDVKIRGTATHIFEKYQQLARDANSAGDRIAAENYLQHAEHYFRLMQAQAAYQNSFQQRQGGQGGYGGPGGGPQPQTEGNFGVESMGEDEDYEGESDPMNG